MIPFPVLQAYAQKINQCLRYQNATSDPAGLQELRRWIDGINRLRVFLAVGNAKNFIAFIGSRLDGGMGPGASHLSDAWYHRFTVSACFNFMRGMSQSGCMYMYCINCELVVPGKTLKQTLILSFW